MAIHLVLKKLKWKQKKQEILNDIYSFQTQLRTNKINDNSINNKIKNEDSDEKVNKVLKNM